MKNTTQKIKRISFLLVAVIVLTASVFAVMSSAAESIETVGEMVDIKANFSQYQVQDTVRSSDEYVGDYQYTVYYDTSKGVVTSGYNGTPVIVYTINTGVDRVGTDSNTKIIESMIGQGYVVIVLDYLGNQDAVGYNLEISVQKFRYKLYNKEILTNKDIFPSGLIRDNFLVPSGYNVLLNQVFWELDKHSVDGTYEQIVANWNSDFRATKGGNLVKWMHTDGTRKATQPDFDGNEPVWYDANGKVDENGEYTYIKYTKAEVVTDCVDPDGSFLDTELRIHIIYPTSPENKVPVMAHACSSGYLHFTPTSESELTEKGQLASHFLLDGYAYALFDYLWQPMGRNTSWGYYDGAQGVSKDHMNYSLHIYNDKLVNTAAMRYIRYTSLSGGDVYNFDVDKIGVFGNSKGGWFNFLGEEVIQSPLVDATKYSTTEEYENAISLALESFTSERTYNGYHGATRYSVGAGEFSGDGITLAAGEKQPWLTCEGKEIISGCQITIPENGGSAIDITEGHMPIFVTSNMTDYLNAHYGVTLDIYNICRELDVPLIHLELPIGHALPTGNDINYNVNSNDIVARFANYYLKNEAISVAYVTPMDNAGSVSATEKITVVFVGRAELDEVEKITVTASDGTVISGNWESSFGGVMWTFTPDMLSGNTEYTLSIPAGFAGTNGAPMKEAYTSSFITEFGVQTAPESVSENVYTFTAPEFTEGNRFVFRFNVTNDAANVAEVYANSADGEKLGSVNLRGKGSYEIDITDYVVANAGKEITLVLKAARAAGDTVVKSDALSTDLSTVGDVKLNTTNVTFAYGSEIGDRAALLASISKAYNYTYSKYYNNPTKILTYYNVTGGEAVTKDDLGRLYTFQIDIYDTVDRVVQLRLRSMTDKTGHQTIDYDNVRFNVRTEANKWTTYTFTYRVYEPDYGTMSQGKSQYIDVLASPDGDTASPIYLSNLVVTENVTEMNVNGAVIAEKSEGRHDYSAPVSASPFAIYNGDTLIGEYATWKETLAAYTSGYTVKLQKDYTLTDADVSDKLANFAEVNLDLGAYTLRLANTSNSLLWIKATNKTATDISVSGGSILIGDTSIVSYESSSTSGSGKSVSISFNSVDIGLDDGSMATKLISSSDLTSGVALKSVISFTDCAFDLPDAKRVYDGATLFPESDAVGLDLSYSVCGGSLAMTSERWITVVENVNSVSFKKDGNGDYTSLVMPASYTYPLEGTYLSENGYVSYAAVSEESNLVTYEFAVSENSTKYGVIPDEYTDGTKYPFLLFKDGSFVSAHSTLSSVTSAAETATSGKGNEGSEAQVLMRADHTATNTGSIAHDVSLGTIVFDLDGHTLRRGGNVVASPEVDGSTSLYYKTTIVFKNGRIEALKGNLFATQLLFSTNGTKYFDVIFENVTLAAAEGATELKAFWVVWHNDHVATTVITNITLRDCTIDLTNAPTLKSKVNLFACGTAQTQFNIVVEGGAIIGDGKYINLGSKDSADTFTFKPNSQGEYIKFIPTSDSVTLPTVDTFVFDDGKYRSFVKNEATGEYVMTESGVETPYGTIPADYADAETYPLAMFQNGEFKEAYMNWNDATKAIPTYAGAKNSDATLLLRRDYMNTDSDCSASAFNQVQSTITIDLGGFALTRGNKTVFGLGTFNDTYSQRVGYIVIKNGKLLINSTSGTANSIFYNQTNTSNKHTKVWNVTIEDVFIGFAEGTARNDHMFWANTTNSSKTTHGATTNVKFNNCTFDLDTNNPGSTPHLFDFKDNNSKNLLDFKVEINGGKIISNNLSGVVLYDLNDGGTDVVTFGKYNGEYTKLITSTTAKDNSHYNKAFPMADGDGYFVEMSDDGINSVYVITSLVTPYGTAPTTAKYLSAVDYPFFIFKDGAFVSATETWNDAVEDAVALVGTASDKNSEVQIVLRRDYDILKSVEGSVNFNEAYGVVVADLGGYTVTTVDGYFIDISLKNASATHLGFSSHLIVRNGVLFNIRSTLPSIGFGHSGASSNGQKKTLEFTFEEVTFKTVNYSVLRDWGHSAETGMNLNIVFDECVFDFGITDKDTTMFYFNSSQKNVVTSVKFIGGEIKTDKNERYTLINYGKDDTVVFSKNDSGNYTVLSQPSKNTSPLPALTVQNEKGVPLTLVKDKTSGSYTIYKLEEFTYAPKVSLTLDRNLVMNVYIPVESTQKFTLDGVNYENLAELSESIVVLDDGKSYYHITLELPAAEAARNIVLSVTVAVGGESFGVSFTMTVPKYAAKLITNGTDVEKTLAKDVLCYVKAAYEYFAEFNTSEEIERVVALVDSIIGDYTSVPVSSGETVTVAPVTAVTLNLGEKPTIRFYLTDTSIEFFLGERKLNTVKGEDEYGVYVELNVYAFALSETITYTGGGSYHISDFVKGSAGKDYETLVKAFVKYTESAADYREAYLAANPEA